MEQNDPTEKHRDRLWNEVWLLEYNSQYAHEAARFMTRRWTFLDLLSRLTTALFASGSAVAGWTVWQAGSGKAFWAILAGLTAIVAIINGVLASQERVKRYTELSGSFVRLSLGLKGLLTRMRIEPEFDFPSARKEFEGFMNRYAELMEGYPEDLFFRDKERIAIQDALTAKLCQTTES